MTYTSVLFDLDGTVVDSSEGVTKSVSYALKKRGYGDVAAGDLLCFIGPPLREQFMAYCGVGKEEGEALVKAYREYYHDTGIWEARVYDGIPALLAAVKKAGSAVLLATSKPEAFAVRILEHFGLAKYFDFVAGANLDNTRTDKAEVIRYALDNLSPEKAARPLMIGDCPQDLAGANACRIASLAVTYGFGDRREMEALCPVTFCDSPEDVQKYLLG